MAGGATGARMTAVRFPLVFLITVSIVITWFYYRLPPDPKPPTPKTGIVYIGDCYEETLAIYSPWTEGSWYTKRGQTGRVPLDSVACPRKLHTWSKLT